MARGVRGLILSVFDVTTYSLVAFIIVLIAGCAINLLKRHYILQIIGIAYAVVLSVIKTALFVKRAPFASFREVYLLILPDISMGLACLVSMALGFWIFPHIRRRM